MPEGFAHARLNRLFSGRWFSEISAGLVGKVLKILPIKSGLSKNRPKRMATDAAPR
jgi:hypothetical protein